MNESEEKKIIQPFKFYPSKKKTNIMTKHFPIIYNPMNNTWFMEGNNIRLINIPNDFWIIEYLDKYVCSFHMNCDSISASMFLPQGERTISMAKIMAIIYGKINNFDTRYRVYFHNKQYIDNNGMMILDVSPSNICLASDKYFIEDQEYIYIQILHLDNIFAKINKEIKDIIINEYGQIRYNHKKGIRTNVAGIPRSTCSLSFVIYNLFNNNKNPQDVRQKNNIIQYNSILNINYLDFTIDNIYCGCDIRIDNQYAYINIPKYNNIESFFDKDIYLLHKEDFDKITCLLSRDGYVRISFAKRPQSVPSALHRYILYLLMIDYKIDPKILKGVEVHHINGNKLDNRIENLFICGPSIHQYIHRNIEKLNSDMKIKSNIIEILTLGYIPEIYLKIYK